MRTVKVESKMYGVVNTYSTFHCQAGRDLTGSAE